MEPNILQGQTVMVSSIPYLFSRPRVGDIVLIRHSGDQAQPETPESLPLNVDRRFWTGQNDEESKFLIKRITKIDGERYFIRGDNKRDSMDSRRLGWVLRKKILGKALFF